MKLKSKYKNAVSRVGQWPDFLRSVRFKRIGFLGCGSRVGCAPPALAPAVPAGPMSPKYRAHCFHRNDESDSWTAKPLKIRASRASDRPGWVPRTMLPRNPHFLPAPLRTASGWRLLASVVIRGGCFARWATGRCGHRRCMEHQRCADMPAQGHALGIAKKRQPALKGWPRMLRPFRACSIFYDLPRALLPRLRDWHVCGPLALHVGHETG